MGSTRPTVSHESIATRRLREQVEQALAGSQSRKVVEPLLERLVHIAPAGSEAALLGHRYLAEYRLEGHPWRALLHLKHVLAAHPEDDVAHAMCGLAHAMSGNYRAAVASYRSATQAAPENPWYHHNLGHLLDVALERPATALPHLRTAFELLGQDEPEVAASLIHCLSGMGPAMKERALSLLAQARRVHPKHASLAELAQKLGLADEPPQPRRAPAPRVLAPPIPIRPTLAPALPATPPATTGHALVKTAASLDAEEDPVIASLRQRLGAHPSRFDTARSIWSRYCETQRELMGSGSRRGRPRNADILAAAVHRIVMRRVPEGGMTLASIARAYGVDPKAVALRSQEIETALS